MTFIPGPLVRSVNGDSFAAIAPGARVVSFAGGVTFDRTLTAAEASAVWWFLSSRDAADEIARRHLKTLLDTNDPGLCAALVRYVLGIEETP